MSEIIKNVEEFIAWTKQLDGQMLLYRGLANANWEIESSAYRRIEKLYNGYPTLAIFQNYVKQLLDNASLQGFRYKNGRKLSELELLAELQHYGAATCLIDFTKNPLIALWFACREKSKKNGKVVVMATDDTDIFSTVSFKHLDKPIEYFFDEVMLWKWVPSSLNNGRIVSQQSVFVFGDDVIYDLVYDQQKVQIDAGSKKDIIAVLDKFFGVNEQNLFNDLAGFALCNAHDKHYDDYTAKDCYRLGLTFQQRGDYEKAKNYYTMTLERDPLFIQAYFNRAIIKHNLNDHQGAISDFDEVIEINPKNGLAYYNRGNVKRALGNLQGAISDYSKALEINPRDAKAYRNRGDAKNASGDKAGAKKDWDKAREIDPNLREPEP